MCYYKERRWKVQFALEYDYTFSEIQKITPLLVSKKTMLETSYSHMAKIQQKS